MGRSRQTGREERAEEDLRVRRRSVGQQRQPVARLLLHSGQALVLQQVGQLHALVAHRVAERQVGGDVEALGRLGARAPASSGSVCQL